MTDRDREKENGGEERGIVKKEKKGKEKRYCREKRDRSNGE